MAAIKNFVEFYARIYVIFIIFYTKIINLQKLCQKLSNDYIWVYADHGVFQIILNVLKVCFLH